MDLKSNEENVKDTNCADQTNNGAHGANMTDAEIYQYYSQWARKGTYDIHLGPQNYRGPEICAKAIAKYTTDKGAKILDVAAGTGRLGMELKKLGYTNIDGLEPAEGMLETARERDVFRDYYCIPFSSSNPDVPSDTYDALGIAGGMGQGHIRCDSLPEMARVVRKGGHVIIVMREAYLQQVAEYKDRLEPKMAIMQEAGVLRQVERTVVPKYSFENNGVVFVFEVL